MSVDPLEWLSAANPVPHGSTAPSLESVLARIQSTGAQPGRRRRGLGGPGPRRVRSGPWAGALIPVLAVAAALTVVAAVIVLGVSHRRPPAPPQAPAATPTTSAVSPSHSIPSPGSLMPRGGMRGQVLIVGAASASADHALIYFGQCQPCHAGGSGPGSGTRLWHATSTDAGTSWHVAPTSLNLTMFAFAGHDGWAEGTGSDRVARFFASHDDGRTWHLASSADPAPGGVGDVSTAGGEVWSLGNRCPGANACTDTMLHAPTSADHLSETQAQPPLGDTTNVSVVAAARDRAYVLTDDYGTNPKIATIAGTRLFATHDGGRTWHATPTPCPRLTFGRLYGGGADALWALCSPMHGPSELRRSTDGGDHWTTLASRPGNIQLQPASAQVVWALTPVGRVFRTSDGGQTWRQVWYGGRPEPSALSGNTPPGLNRSWSAILTVQSPTTATVIAVVTRGHGDGHAARTNFVWYHTTDGGQTWRPSVVLLPAG